MSSFCFCQTLSFEAGSSLRVNSNNSFTLEGLELAPITAYAIEDPNTPQTLYRFKKPKKSVLFNVNGQKVLEPNHKEINVSDFPTGAYILHTTNNQKSNIHF